MNRQCSSYPGKKATDLVLLPNHVPNRCLQTLDQPKFPQAADRFVLSSPGMPPLRELRYDRVTLSPRPRSSPLSRRVGVRQPFRLSDIFPPVDLRAFLPPAKRRNARRDVAAAGGDYAGADYPAEPLSLVREAGEPALECWSGEEDSDGAEDLDLHEDDLRRSRGRATWSGRTRSVSFPPSTEGA